MPVWGYLYFQNGASPVMEQLIFFHDHTMMVMVLVLVLVGYVLLSSVFMNYYSIKVREGQELESIWTVMPALILLLIAFPSLRLLYLMEEADSCEVGVSVTGHQWYWSYEYSNMMKEEFDSYMAEGDFRLLEVDEYLIMPSEVNVRAVITAEDVIHSWTVPAFGVKADAVPGRLNQVLYFIKRVGMYFGQCSEICGANHSFMPIALKSISVGDFIKLL